MFLRRLHVRVSQEQLNSAYRNAFLQQADSERVAEAMGVGVNIRQRAETDNSAPQAPEKAGQLAATGPEEVLIGLTRHRVQGIHYRRRQLHMQRSLRLHRAQEQPAVFSEAIAFQFPGVRNTKPGINEQQNQSTRTHTSTCSRRPVVVLDQVARPEKRGDFILTERQCRSGVFSGRFQRLRRIRVEPPLCHAERAERPHEFQFSSLSGRHDLAARAIRGQQRHSDGVDLCYPLGLAELNERRESNPVAVYGARSEMPRFAIAEVRGNGALDIDDRDERLLRLAFDLFDAAHGHVPVAESEGSAVVNSSDFADRPDRAGASGVVLPSALEATPFDVPPVQPQLGAFHGSENTTKTGEASTITVHVVQSDMKPQQKGHSEWGGIWDSFVSTPQSFNDLPLFHSLESGDNPHNSLDSVRVGTHLYYTHEIVPLPPHIHREVVSYQGPYEEWKPCPIPADPLLPKKAIEALEWITKDPPCWGYVYIIEAEGLRRVKIGESHRSPESCRASGVQTGCPAPLRVLRSLYGHRGHEQALHNAFASEHITGEWFHYSRRIQRLVELTAELDTRMLERFSRHFFIVPSDPTAQPGTSSGRFQEWRTFDNACNSMDFAKRWAWRCCDLVLREGTEEEKKEVRKLMRERKKSKRITA